MRISENLKTKLSSAKAIRAFAAALVMIVLITAFGASNKAFAATISYPRLMPDPATSIAAGIRGDYLGGQEAALKRINEIRLEACKKGYPDPRNSSRKLTMADYVPLKWSATLEEDARWRAAEACVCNHHSMTGMYETPANIGDEYDTGMECLAYGVGNYPNSMLEAVNLWYAEKKNWVGSGSGETGHYLYLIDPDLRYVGIGSFRAKGILGSERANSAVSAHFNDEFTGFFGVTSGGESMQPAVKDVIQVISIYKDNLVGSTFLTDINGVCEVDGKNKLSVMQTEKLEFGIVRKASYIPNALRDKKAVPALVLDLKKYTYSSSNPKVLAVTSDGRANALKSGTAVVTAKCSDGTKYSVNVSVWSYLGKPVVVKTKRSGKKLAVTFETDDLATGTQLQIAENKAFTKGLKTATIKVKWDKKEGDYQTRYKKTIKGLKKKGKLYVRVRAYKKTDGGTYYSRWSKIKKVK